MDLVLLRGNSPTPTPDCVRRTASMHKICTYMLSGCADDGVREAATNWYRRTRRGRSSLMHKCQP
ncbi:uncharacterized protein TRAVEDRAFT_60023 [Trametes versicolor FP-101664 SS1]|uniref:uncharacterized protein n=1 Tax=Trametes versicolor (strain FP-101664) TaxID=717944 RepID=UPI0004621443|nr:uncharacterized protein TRAVEDRAFT_60023 [Trametes versicolor FP-101664 SS1]EIW55860.1 hypothetical protein TRAVEDRAFT_60023 [Trametes versicolor FP-101664 SS1]